MSNHNLVTAYEQAEKARRYWEVMMDKEEAETKATIVLKIKITVNPRILRAT
ncbi:MAG: hypothetical protein IJU76_08290 [Desulfovibrionaceae bacterium]|nr:hypothetical protein [Desulfovibrionaceae bacterium]